MPERRILTRSALLAAGLLGFAALGSCSDSTAVGSADLTEVLAQFAGVEPSFGIGLGRGGAVEYGPTGTIPGSCPFNAASALFECPEVTTSGVSVQRSYQLLSEGSVPLTAFDPGTVAAVRVVSEASGAVSTPASFCCLATLTSFTSAGDATYSGLISGSRVINGTRTTVGTFTRGGKSATSTTVLTMLNVAPPLTAADVQASGGWGFPKSGKVTSTVTGTDTLGVAFTAQVETTFNGTATVVTVVSKSGTTTRYTCTWGAKSTSNGTSVFVTCESFPLVP